MNAIVTTWMLVMSLILGSAAGVAHSPQSYFPSSTDIQLSAPPENDPPLQPDPNKGDGEKKKEKKADKPKAKTA